MAYKTRTEKEKRKVKAVFESHATAVLSTFVCLSRDPPSSRRPAVFSRCRFENREFKAERPSRTFRRVKTKTKKKKCSFLICFILRGRARVTRVSDSRPCVSRSVRIYFEINCKRFFRLDNKVTTNKRFVLRRLTTGRLLLFFVETERKKVNVYTS